LALRRALASAFENGPPGPIELRAGKEDFHFSLEHADAVKSSFRTLDDGLTPDLRTIRAVMPGREEGPSMVCYIQVSQEDSRILISNDTGQTLAEEAYGTRTSLLPPLLAILLAFMLRNTWLSLLVGALAGAILLVPETEAFTNAFGILFWDILFEEILLDPFHAYILGFTLILSGTVALLTRMGAIDGLVQAMMRWAHSSQSVQAVAYFLGFGIFFDDYANTMVVGNSCSPLFDRMKVSRAKLAYIVDSTAAPIAGVAVLSTWVAFQISTFAPQLPTIGLSESQGYSIFLETIPYRFYCLLALGMVGLTIFLQRDFGPMLRSESRARLGMDKRLDVAGPSWSHIERAPWTLPRWENGLFPILTLIGVTGWSIYALGVENIPIPEAMKLKDQGLMPWLREVLSQSDSTKAIFLGSAAAWGLAALLSLARRQLGLFDVLKTSLVGSITVARSALAILILAWCIGVVCMKLDTAGYLVSISSQLTHPSLLPIILFLTSCFVAFATGSSWTTMAILQPNVVLLAHRMGEMTELGSHGMLVLCVGAVLEGSIFGDHCSPISDTTILSSTASSCEHIEHVRTQAPYALVCAGLALLVGYVPAAFFGVPPLLSLGVGGLSMISVLLIFGRNPSQTRVGLMP
jgi:Na+/H+ antiporter NhaC